MVADSGDLDSHDESVQSIETAVRHHLPANTIRLNVYCLPGGLVVGAARWKSCVVGHRCWLSGWRWCCGHDRWSWRTHDGLLDHWLLDHRLLDHGLLDHGLLDHGLNRLLHHRRLCWMAPHTGLCHHAGRSRCFRPQLVAEVLATRTTSAA